MSTQRRIFRLSSIMNDKFDDLKPGAQRARSGNSFEFSSNTLFTWRKNSAMEIEYFIKTRRDFYNFFLRNQN